MTTSLGSLLSKSFIKILTEYSEIKKIISTNNKIKALNTEKLIDYVNTCKIPKFPISGDYLKKYGYETGQTLGKKLKSLEEKWIENDFIIEKKVIEQSLGKVNKN